jgi:phage terminase small subunit
MKKPDIEKEEKFVRNFVATGNATESARLSGYGNNSGQMGYYLKNKLKPQIEKGLRDVCDSLTPKSITVMAQMLDSKSDSVKLATCKYILSDLNGFGKENINLHVNHVETEQDRSTIEMIKEACSYLTEEEYQECIAQDDDEQDRNFKTIINVLRTAKLKRA